MKLPSLEFRVGALALVLGCGTPGAAESPSGGEPVAEERVPESEASPSEIPEHLQHFPGLYARQGESIVDAPPADQTLARSYPSWTDRGQLVNGMRLTIMTGELRVSPGEEVRIVHVLEATEPGHEVFVMGPKDVHGEYVDSLLATSLPPVPTYPWLGVYDGRVLDSPAADYNYEVTSYRFSTPGPHRIQWRLGDLESNILEIHVAAGD